VTQKAPNSESGDTARDLVGEFRGIEAAYPLDPLPSNVTVLPISRSKDKGLYPAAATDLVKLLREAKVEAAFLDTSDRREWQVHMGDVVEQLVIGVASGLISIATWQAMVAVIKDHFGKAHNRVTLVDTHDNTGEAHWFQVEGDAEAVAAALAEYMKKRGRSKKSGD
jgi:hypothetical protein